MNFSSPAHARARAQKKSWCSMLYVLDKIAHPVYESTSTAPGGSSYRVNLNNWFGSGYRLILQVFSYIYPAPPSPAPRRGCNVVFILDTVAFLVSIYYGKCLCGSFPQEAHGARSEFKKPYHQQVRPLAFASLLAARTAVDRE